MNGDHDLDLKRLGRKIDQLFDLQILQSHLSAHLCRTASPLSASAKANTCHQHWMYSTTTTAALQRR